MYRMKWTRNGPLTERFDRLILLLAPYNANMTLYTAGVRPEQTTLHKLFLQHLAKILDNLNPVLCNIRLGRGDL